MLTAPQELVGNATGYTDLASQGKQRRTEGDAEVKAAEAKGCVRFLSLAR